MESVSLLQIKVSNHAHDIVPFFKSNMCSATLSSNFVPEVYANELGWRVWLTGPFSLAPIRILVSCLGYYQSEWYM